MKQTYPQLFEQLGTVLVTGGSGFVGQNLVKVLLDNGCKVRSFDLAPNTLAHENLESVQGNICDQEQIEAICEGVDTVFHTAAIIELKSSDAVDQTYRDRNYNINVEGTKNLLISSRKAGATRFIYTASNSVVIGREQIYNGNEDMPYISEFKDLYTETKVVAEKWVLSQNGIDGMHSCSIRPSGIWGPGDKTMFAMIFEQIHAGMFVATVGDSNVKLDNSYVFNLIHGKILAALNLGEDGSASGQAYFINDDDPVNMLEFSKPVILAVGAKYPKINLPYKLVHGLMSFWEKLNHKFNFPEPPLPPLALDRIGLNNYFSVDKARKDLGYEPLYTTDEGIKECIPYYQQLFEEMRPKK